MSVLLPSSRTPRSFRSSWGLAILTVLAMVLALLAAGPAAPASAATPGSIAGNVKGQTTVGQPNANLSNVYVELYDKPTGTLVNATYTNASGNYSFTGVEPGGYLLSFAPADAHAGEWYNDKATQALANTVTVTSGTATSGLATLLSSTIGSVAGTVKGQTTVGQPDANLENVYVQLFSAGSGDLVNAAYTAADGTYRFDNVPIGTYRLSYSPGGTYAGEWYNDKLDQASADNVTVTAGATTGGLSTLLTSTIGTVTGTVKGTQMDGAPAALLENVYVQLFDADTLDLVTAGYTAADGTYRFDGVPIGSYTAFFTGPANYADQWYANKQTQDTANVITVANGATASGVDVTLGLTVGAVAGSVTGQTTVGSPDVDLANVYVELYDSITGNLTNATYTDGNGDYRFDTVPVGTYQLNFSPGYPHKAEWYDDKPDQANATVVTVTSATTTAGLNTLLASTIGSITGAVRGTAKVGQSTTPLSNVYIEVYAKPSGDLVTAGYSESTGAYRFDGVPVGDYTVHFSDNADYFGEWFVDKPTQTFAATVTVQPGATRSGVDALLSKTANDYALVPQPVPTISGTPRFPQTLTATVGTWGPGTVTTSIQWYRNGTAISGATSANYALVLADIDASLTVRVTGSKSGFRTATQTSAAVTGQRGVLAPVTPTVSGAGVVDAPLTGTAPAWGPSPVTLSYQWFAGSTAIPGATSLGYTPTAAQLGAALKLTVTGTKQGYTTATSSSAAVVVGPATIDAKTPSISGMAKVDQVLTANSGSWTPAPVAYTYVWSAGGTVIPGATADSYTVEPATVGKTITVAVTGTKAGYTTRTVSSPATAAVLPATLTPATPTISGTARVGVKLTATAGTWAPAPVALAYQWKAGGVSITGATATTFTPTASQAGKAITVTVTGTKAGYTTASATSAATSLTAPGVITSTTPTLSGTPNVGTAVSAVVAGWGPGTLAYSYAWLLDGTAIAGATASSYTPVEADAGHGLSVKVTATKTGYTTKSATSAAKTVLGQALTTAVPTISGTTTVGKTLTASAGAWGPSPVTLSYQWSAGGTAIAGATSSTLVLGNTQRGATITVTVTGVKSGYESASATSAATAVIAAGTITGTTPTISGQLVVGSTLTANAGVWAPAPVVLSYQWKANGVSITGATSATYVVQASTLGKRITVFVTGTKSGYTTKTISSASSAIVASGTITGATPTISGTARVGQVLSANTGTWSPSGVAFGYQWFAGGTAISGATGSSYTVQAADVGKTISVTVTGTKAGYTTVARSSAATATVATGTLTSATPTISGTAKVGQALTVNPGGWGPAGVALAYQWRVGGTSVTGATATVYTPVAADLGKTVTVSVTGTLPGYSTVTKSSSATASVVAGTITTGTLSISGTAKVGSTLAAKMGVWGPAPVATNIQWYRNGAVIVGATGATRVLTANDAGAVMSFRVGGTKSGYTSVTKTSPNSAVVAKGTITTHVPSMSGTLKVGSTLTANLNGTWGPSPVTLEYRWTADAVAIPGANGPTFKLTSAQAGKRIILKIIGTKAGYTDAAAQSPYSAVVVN